MHFCLCFSKLRKQVGKAEEKSGCTGSSKGTEKRTERHTSNKH